jgi:hypothetical protein
MSPPTAIIFFIATDPCPPHREAVLLRKQRLHVSQFPAKKISAAQFRLELIQKTVIVNTNR